MKRSASLIINLMIIFSAISLFANQNTEKEMPMNYYERQSEGLMSHPMFPAFFQLSSALSMIKTDLIHFNLPVYGLSPFSGNPFFSRDNDTEKNSRIRNEGQLADFIFTMGIFSASTAGSKIIDSKDVFTVIPIFPIYSNILRAETKEREESRNYGLYFIFSSEF